VPSSLSLEQSGRLLFPALRSPFDSLWWRHVNELRHAAERNPQDAVYHVSTACELGRNYVADGSNQIRLLRPAQRTIEQKHDAAVDLSRPGKPQKVSHIPGHEDSIILERELKNLAIGATKATAIANVDHINGFELSQTLRDSWRQLLIEE
jgi:hypothetical protein